jgi:hypothetical protein
VKDAETFGEEDAKRVERFVTAGAAIRDERIRSIIADIKGWSAQKWTYEDAPNLVVYSVIELAYSYPKRAHDLIESMRTLMQADRVVPAVILARALVETIAMGRYFIEKMEKCVEETDFPKLEASFLRFYAGSKLGSASVKAIHVNDALRELEAIDLAYLSYLAAKYPSLWNAMGADPVQAFKDNASLLKTYDKLSEISHPNGLGTQYLYPAADAPDNEKVVEHYRYMTGVAIWQAHHLLTALECIKTFPDRFVSTFPGRTRFSTEAAAADQA